MADGQSSEAETFHIYNVIQYFVKQTSMDTSDAVIYVMLQSQITLANI